MLWSKTSKSCLCYDSFPSVSVMKTLELTWRNFQLFPPKYWRNTHHLHTGNAHRKCLLETLLTPVFTESCWPVDLMRKTFALFLFSFFFLSSTNRSEAKWKFYNPSQQFNDVFRYFFASCDYLVLRLGYGDAHVHGLEHGETKPEDIDLFKKSSSCAIAVRIE